MKMANIALIIAGGVGARMGQDIPKQFINVYDKPVLIYTLEGFQKHPQIDAIEVVCIDGWHDIVWAYAKQFNITKLKWIVSVYMVSLHFYFCKRSISVWFFVYFFSFF